MPCHARCGVYLKLRHGIGRRAVPLTEEIIVDSTRRLVRETDRYLKLVRAVEGECSRLVRDNGIHASVQSRVKKPDSFAGKLRRYLSAGSSAKIDTIQSDEDVFKRVGDIAAVRVATYVEGDRERVARLIEARFTDVVVERLAKPTGYRATHCQVHLPATLLAAEENANIADLSCEIQVCSMLAHVWNEIEHDVRYKLDGVRDVDEYERSRLQALLDVMKDGDGSIEDMLRWRSLRVAQGLVEPVARRFPKSSDFRFNADYVLREAVRLGYTNLTRIDELLLLGDFEEEGRLLIDLINASLKASGEESSAMNAATSDILLALLLRRHYSDICGLYFREIESGDAKRIPFLANFVEEHDILR